MAAVARPYDIVIWGATGFTGRLVAEHIVRDYRTTGLKWAIAGRSEKRLEQLRQELGERFGCAMRSVPILAGDVTDQASLDAIAAKTRVIIAAAGPFTLCGTPVVDAAVRCGCDYVDINGEPGWTRRIIQLYHEEAVRKCLRIVPSCGFDSVPFDLGAMLAVQHLQRRYGKQAGKVVNAIMEAQGGISGGTFASIMVGYSDLHLSGDSVYSLVPGEAAGTDGEFWGLEHCPALGRYLTPFLIQAGNTRTVRRSNYLLRYDGGSHTLQYHDSQMAGSWLEGKVAQLSTNLIIAMARRPWLHPLLRHMGPAPGQGPTREAMQNGFFRNRVLAWSKEEDGSPPVLVQARVSSDSCEGGYWGASRMVLEAALCLLNQKAELDAQPDLVKGGILTPAAAMGTVLMERLRRVGMTFEVVEEAA